MADAKGVDDDRAEAKGDYAEAKGESKDGGGDAKGGGRRASVFEGLLKLVAEDADTKLFGGDADLMVWVADHASEWDDAVEGERTGSGSPMKKMTTRRTMTRPMTSCKQLQEESFHSQFLLLKGSSFC